MAAPICITPDKICGGPNHVPRSAVQLPTQISQASPKGRPPSPGSRSSLVSAKLVPDALFALVTANVCATVAFARTLSGAPEPFCPVQSLPTGRLGRRRDLPPNGDVAPRNPTCGVRILAVSSPGFLQPIFPAVHAARERHSAYI